ncbi:hypothetical protein PUMCH_001354 [Australozyma saopauloensis]|uniref:Uncharacterized protein n=1 Tax=Australozyma saopauloensis TaxID=291208 RepID=A0AAX4H6E5_9ASCO|nr:hypothetical protein PUMCH_001354 [[Candida] saopauloensis]
MWKTKFDFSLNQVYYENTSDGSISFDLPCEVQNLKSKPKGKLFSQWQSRFCPVARKSLPKCDVVADSAVAKSTTMRKSSTISSDSSTLVQSSPSETFQPLLEARPSYRSSSPSLMSSEGASDSTKRYTTKPSKTSPRDLYGSEPRSPTSPKMNMLAYFPLLTSKYQHHFAHMDDTNMWPATLDVQLRLLEGYESDISSESGCDSVRSFYSELPRNEVYYDEEYSVYVDQHMALGDRERERNELRLQILQELY